MLVELSGGRIVNINHILMIREGLQEEGQYRMYIVDFDGSIPITKEDRDKILLGGNNNEY